MAFSAISFANPPAPSSHEDQFAALKAELKSLLQQSLSMPTFDAWLDYWHREERLETFTDLFRAFRRKLANSPLALSAPSQPRAQANPSDAAQESEVTRYLESLKEACEQAAANGDSSFEIRVDHFALVRAERTDRDVLRSELVEVSSQARKAKRAVRRPDSSCSSCAKGASWPS